MMKSVENNLVAELQAALGRYLADVPFCSLRAGKVQAGGIDWLGEILLPSGTKPILLEAKASGEPRAARSVAGQLLRYRAQNPDACLIFGAPYISAEAAAILRQDGIGYLDLSGNCRLCFDDIYVFREGRPNKFVQRRLLRSLFSPRAERVLRVLLADPNRRWKTAPLAKSAKVSLGQVAKVKALLEGREWVSREPHGLWLSRPTELLEWWSANYRYDRNLVRNFYSLNSIPELEGKLAQACSKLQQDYCLTGFSAAARLAPMVRYQRASAYVAGDIDQVAGQLGLKEVTTGANISLITPYDEGVLFDARTVGGVEIASAVQVYLDLLSSKARGEEAAKAVLEQVIKPTW